MKKTESGSSEISCEFEHLGLIKDGPDLSLLYDSAKGALGQVAHELMVASPIRDVVPKDQNPKTGKQFKTNLEQFLYNCLRCLHAQAVVSASGGGQIVRVALAKSAMFRKKSRYKALHMSFRHVNTILTAFSQLSWIEVTEAIPPLGNRSRGSVTRIRPTPAFSEMLRDHSKLETSGDVWSIEPRELIVLKEGKGKAKKRLVEYSDTPESETLRSQLSVINARSHSIPAALSIPDKLIDEIEYTTTSTQPPTTPITCNTSLNHGNSALCTRLRIKTDEVKDLSFKISTSLEKQGDRWVCSFSPSDLTYKRVFSRGRWDLGGRLYAPHQNLPSYLRPFIMIGGEPTGYMDYSALHPSILYAEVGATCYGDPYEVDLPVGRSTVKKVFNVMVNALSYPRVYAKIKSMAACGKLDFAGYEATEIVAAIRKRHRSIKGAFGSDSGVRLQYRDSQLALRVLNEVECLAIHDGFVARATDSARLLAAMRDAYKTEIGGPITITEEDWATGLSIDHLP